MAASKLILSHARRHYTPIASQPSHLSSLLVRSSSNSQNLTSFLGFRRFSTDSPPESEPKPLTSSPPPPPKPVSYAPKPKPPSEEPQQQEQPRPLRRNRDEFPSSTEEGGQGGGRVWTREDIRYVKDVPSISPVSYPSRVANLPEDRAAAETTVDGEGKEETRKDDSMLERERRKIDNDRRLRRAFRVEEEKVLPFPTLIKVEKKKSKVVLDLQEAIREVKANAKSSFVETVEAHVGLGVDPRRGDQMVRGAATLPHGTGKVVRVAVFAEGDAAEEARAAGADIVGAEELIEEIRKGGGKLNFDKCIATPIFMPRLGKIARILGPRGLMPNPKLGSVTSDVAGAVREAKRGRIDFKIDKTAIVHVGLGKVNFSDESLRENVGAFVNALLRAKPVGLKKTSKYAGYVNSFSLSSTMGPGFPVSIQSLSMAAEHYARLKLQ